MEITKMLYPKFTQGQPVAKKRMQRARRIRQTKKTAKPKKPRSGEKRRKGMNMNSEQRGYLLYRGQPQMSPRNSARNAKLY